jgi:methylaspartate ammonia-lyase
VPLSGAGNALIQRQSARCYEAARAVTDVLDHSMCATGTRASVSRDFVQTTSRARNRMHTPTPEQCSLHLLAFLYTGQ